MCELPCLFCKNDLKAKEEMIELNCLVKGNSHFCRELIATYHTMIVTMRHASKYYISEMLELYWEYTSWPAKYTKKAVNMDPI